MADSSFFQMAFGSGRSTAGHGSRAIGIAHFVRVQLWAVGRQIAHVDVRRVLPKPLCDRRGVVYLEIV